MEINLIFVQVVSTSKSYTLDKEKIHRLIDKYVTRQTGGSAGNKK